jgi:long-chain fatty acid transport protein
VRAMHRLHARSLLALFLGALVSIPAFAAGFALPEQSARSIGMGGTGTAAADGASTIFYNPGALGFEEGFSAEVSGLLILPQFGYAPLTAVLGTPASAATRLLALPTLFVAAPIGPVRIGLGAFANYGLGLTWPEGFDGRFEATASNLQTFTLNPTAAWRINEHLSFGAGVDVVRGTIELVRQLDFVDSEGTLRLGGDTWGVGGNAGISTHFLSDRLGVGLSYRSAVSLKFKGRADFTAPVEFQAQLRDQDVKTALLLPHTISLGGAFRVTQRWRVTLEATYTTWSTLDALVLEFADASINTTLRRDWTNTLTVRAGGELMVIPKTLQVRLGLGFDPSPSPASTLSPSLPDASRLLVGLGVGYVRGNFSADLGYLFTFLLPRASEPPAFPARYSGTAHVFGLSVGFKQ